MIYMVLLKLCGGTPRLLLQLETRKIYSANINFQIKVINAMKIELTFGTLPDGSNQLTGFYIFWLMYVHGFSPHFHCQKSLRGKIDPFFHKEMEIGKTYTLRNSSRVVLLPLISKPPSISCCRSRSHSCTSAFVSAPKLRRLLSPIEIRAR